MEEYVKTIWKFELQASESQIEMPEGAEILTLQMQNGVPCIWALVDPAEPIQKRYFEIFGTGHPIPQGVFKIRKYINTYQVSGLVFHVFERCKG
jgi:hypothetical protein